MFQPPSLLNNGLQGVPAPHIVLFLIKGYEVAGGSTAFCPDIWVLRKAGKETSGRAEQNSECKPFSQMLEGSSKYAEQSMNYNRC